MSDSFIIFTKEQWEESYKPLVNPLDPSRRSFGPAEEEIKLLDNFENNRIWSVLWDFYEEREFLSPGFYPPDDSNEDVFYVTEKPWDDERIRVVFPYE